MDLRTVSYTQIIHFLLSKEPALFYVDIALTPNLASLPVSFCVDETNHVLLFYQQYTFIIPSRESEKIYIYV
ncbi:hypothetical protein ACQP3C_30405, partial [Escherichia coli]